jgi:hypothetical protein
MSPPGTGKGESAIYKTRNACSKLLIAFVALNVPIQSLSAQSLVFPTAVEQFIKMTEIQQKEYERTVIGKRIRGSGRITNVEECDFLSKSKLYRRDCYEIVIDRGVPRAVVFVSKKDRNRVINLKKGDEFTFNDCIVTGIKNVGFWSSVYCDLPT